MVVLGQPAPRPAVSATPTDRTPRRPRSAQANARAQGARRARPFPALAPLLAILVASLLTACAEEPLPQRRISRDDCLSEVKLDQLREAIARCDKVVAAFPKDPLPLNERYLLHTLAEDDRAACRDIVKAAALARRLPPERLDAMLRSDLKRRLADCQTAPVDATAAPVLPQAAPGAPSGGGQGAGGKPEVKQGTPGEKGAPAQGRSSGSPAVQKLPHQNR